MTRGKFVSHIAPISLRRLFGISDEQYIIPVMVRLPNLVFETENHIFETQNIEYV